MSSNRNPRATTLARLMVLNAAFALTLAAYRLGFAGLARYALYFSAAWGLVLVVLTVNSVLDRVVGVRCPRCQRSALRRLALPFSFVAYFECTACRLRCKRTSPFTPWRDASSPEDAGKYRRKSSATRWLGYTVPEGSDSTCGTLLRSKRGRAASLARDETRVESGRSRP